MSTTIKSFKMIGILCILNLLFACVPLAIGTGAGYIAAQSGPTLSDTEITTKVKVKLLSTRGIQSGLISVSTDQGIVTLAGHQPSQAMYDKVDRVTKKISGVKKVNNHMSIYN